jgi:hypothetical protein
VFTLFYLFNDTFHAVTVVSSDMSVKSKTCRRLGCDAVLLAEKVPTFRKIVLSSSSGLNIQIILPEFFLGCFAVKKKAL